MSTLLQIVTKVRGYLDDEVEDYAWSNDELTGYLNESVNELCRKLRLIEDASTAAICQHALTAGGHTLTLSPRITGIERVELNSTGAVLVVVDHVREVDARFSGWKTADASVPQYLIKGGLGTGVARVYPATLLADQINLTVHRLPLVDLDWDTDQAVEPEILSTYHDLLYPGILYRAYDKRDVDTYDPVKSAEERTKWLASIEELKSAERYRQATWKTVTPHAGNL